MVRWTGVAAIAALLCASSSASAATCSELRSQKVANAQKAVSVIADWPKTHAAILGCYASQDTDDNAAACVAMIVGAVCLGEGLSACTDLMSRWDSGSREFRSINRQMHDQGCSE